VEVKSNILEILNRSRIYQSHLMLIYISILTSVDRLPLKEWKFRNADDNELDTDSKLAAGQK